MIKITEVMMVWFGWYFIDLRFFGVGGPHWKTYIYVRCRERVNVPLWHFSITKKLSKSIERVQKAAVFVILGKLATLDYFCNLALLELEPLSDRRDKLCRKFARKTIKHPFHSKMFSMVEGRTTRTKRRVIVPEAKTARYDKSTIPNLARIINSL